MTASNSAPVDAAAGLSDAAPARASKSREIRVGLVMYGGVSLAVYINGVAREFFDAVRGRGVYRLLKALTDSDIVVDIVSGTSAGGINGILLGYALCNEREFSACADLWRRHGDIARLLRNPREAREKTLSLLDSEDYYQPRLAAAFAGMAPCDARRREDTSPTREFDLFVTGTEIEGRRYTVLDDAGHAVDVKDHRTVFLLKHRAGWRHPFSPAFNHPDGTPDRQAAVTHGALAKLGRITSCFPVAFAPVPVTRVMKASLTAASGTDARIDALLTEWGALKRDSCFLDGGILDNKPFTYTVREIFRRTAERDVERRLFYVEPDPERFEDVESVTQPDVLRAARLALVGIPAYESIADDLKLLSERNAKIRTYKRLADALPDTGRPMAAADAIYRRSRLVALSQRVVAGLLRVDGVDQLLDAPSRFRAEKLFDEFDEYADAAGLASTLLLRYDIYYRLRRVVDLIYHVFEHGRCDREAPRDPCWSDMLWVLNRQFKLLDIVRNAMEELIDTVNFDWRGKSPKELWQCVGDAFSRLLAASPEDNPVPAGYGSTRDDEVVQDLLGRTNRNLKARIEIIKAEIARGMLAPAAPGTANLLEEADVYERRMIGGFAVTPVLWKEAPLARYERFEQIDAFLYPLEMFGEVREKDEIRTVRISPVDAQRGFSRRDAAEKTAGQTLAHFGGFFRRSWRSNDILCGRLDALAQIIEEFFDPHRIATVVQRNPELAEMLKARLADDLDPAVLFPNAGKPTQDTLRAWLTALVDPAPASAAAGDIDSLLTLLVEAAQLEILHDDLHKLAADEALESAQWRSDAAQRIAPVTAVADAERKAAQQLAQTEPETRTPAAGPRETTFGRFFVQHGDDIGGRSVVDSMPPLVLLETLATALLVTRDAVMTALGKHARAARASAAYTWIDRALRLFYGSVVFARRAPPQFVSAMAAVGAVSVAAIAVGTVWWNEIVAPGGTVQLRWLVFFILAPAAILALQSSLLLGASRHRRWLPLAGVVAAIVVVAVAIWQREALAAYLAGLLEGMARWLRG